MTRNLKELLLPFAIHFSMSNAPISADIINKFDLPSCQEKNFYFLKICPFQQADYINKSDLFNVKGILFVFFKIPV